MDKKFFEVLLQALGIVVSCLLVAICCKQAEHFATVKPDVVLYWRLLAIAFGGVAGALVVYMFSTPDDDEDDLP